MPLDIGVGILLALFTAHVFAITATWHVIAFGIIAALLPDIDIITLAWGTWRHRELTHYPLVYVPLTVLVYLAFGSAYAFLFFGCVFAHLVHDTLGIGWGISWFWPFTKRRFLFLPEKGRRARYGWFMTWLPEEQVHIIEDSSPHHWVITYYLRPSVLGAIEYGVLLIGIAALIFHIR
jgi:hypothetical protein